MILDGFNLIESSKTGALTFRKENHTIFFSPHLLPKESQFISVTSQVYCKNTFRSNTKRFDSLKKAIEFINDELEKSKQNV